MATVPWNDFQKFIVGVGTSYLFQWLQWLQWGVTFSQVVWLIGC